MLRLTLYIALMHTIVITGCTPTHRDIGDAVEIRNLQEQQIDVAIVFPTVDLRQAGQYRWRFNPTISESVSPQLWSATMSESDWSGALASTSIEMCLNGADGRVVWRSSLPSSRWRVLQPTEQWTGTNASPLEWAKLEAGTNYEFVLKVDDAVDGVDCVVTPRMIKPRNPYSIPSLLGLQ